MRNGIQDFSLANPIYAGATVTFYTVSGGVKTATKATLYADTTSTSTLLNPQYLDADGKFVQPVYVDVPVVATMSGLSIADHDTGIIQNILASPVVAGNPLDLVRVNAAGTALETKSIAQLALGVLDVANIWSAVQTFVAPILGTPSSGVTDNLTTTTTATAITDTDFVDITLAAGGKRKTLWTAVKTYLTSTFAAIAGSASQTFAVAPPTAASHALPASSLRGYIDGLIMSTAGGSGSISIGAGNALDSSNSLILSLAASLTKTTSSWAVGTGNGGLDVGVISAASWYHFYLIRRPDTGVVDVVFSLNATSPALPANYTQSRYIGSGLTVSSLWRKFQQFNDTFMWDAPAALDINTAVQGTSTIQYTLPTPLGIVTKAKIVGYITNVAGTNSLKIFSPNIADTNAASAGNITAIVPSNGGYASFEAEVLTNTSSQVSAFASAASTTLVVSCQGYINNRGRNL